MERRQPLGLILDLSARGFWKRLEWLDLDAASLITPGAGDSAIDQEGWHRMRRLGVEDEGPVRLRQDLGAPGVDQQRRIPRREEADGRRRRGTG